MPFSEIMEPGSQLKTAGNIVFPRQGQKNQTEGQGPDFLMDVLLKHLEAAKQSPEECRQESSEKNSQDKGSSSLNLGEVDQGNKLEKFAHFPTVRSFFSGKGIILHGFLNKAAEDNSSLSGTLLLNKGNGPVSNFDPGTQVSTEEAGEGIPGSVNSKQRRSGEGGSVKESPSKPVDDISGLGFVLSLNEGRGMVIKFEPLTVDGTPGNGEADEKDTPDLLNPEQKGAVEEYKVNESPGQKEGCFPPLDDNFFLNKGKEFAKRIAQSLVAGTAGNIPNSEERKLEFFNSIESASERDNIEGEKSLSEIFKVMPTQDRQSSHSIVIGKGEGEPAENGKARQQVFFSFSKDTVLDVLGGPSFLINRAGNEMASDFEGSNNKNLTREGDTLQGEGSGQVHILPVERADRAFGEAIGAEKFIIDKQKYLDQLQKPIDGGFLKDHFFTLKKQTSSTMEISLEPAGLGKLDIELSLTHDRLQGQILVNDNAGKDLIEQNLPQLISELTREGLQIGGFTVSLKNQGRGQSLIPIRMEVNEPSLEIRGPEKFGPVQGNHLIHIII